MEDEIRARVGETGRTRIVCRTGSPIDLDDLDIASVQRLALDHRALAAGRRPRRRRHQDVAGHHQRSEPSAGALPRGRGDPRSARTSTSRGWSAATRSSSCSSASSWRASPPRRAGSRDCRSCTWSCSTSAATRSTSTSEPALVGRTVRRCPLRLRGLGHHRTRRRRADAAVPAHGHRRSVPETAVIAISEDDDTVRVRRRGRVEADAIVDADARRDRRPPQPERTLLLGWNWRGRSIIRELEHYLEPGSRAQMVVTDLPGVHRRPYELRPERQRAARVEARRHHRPTDARRASRPRTTTWSSCPLLGGARGRTACRRPDPGDAAPPARHRRRSGIDSRSSARCSTFATGAWPRSPERTTSSSATDSSASS